MPLQERTRLRETLRAFHVEGMLLGDALDWAALRCLGMKLNELMLLGSQNLGLQLQQVFFLSGVLSLLFYVLRPAAAMAEEPPLQRRRLPRKTARAGPRDAFHPGQ